MDYNSFQKQLDSYTNKLAQNLYQLKTSLCILETISEFSDKINEHNYGNFFFVTEQRMIENAILTTTKIYENNKATTNIKNINNFIMTNIKQLTVLGMPNNKKFKYFIENYDKYKKVKTYKTKIGISTKTVLDINFNSIVISQLIEKFKEFEANFSKDILALKAIRDTSIAHTDKKTKEVDRTTWDKVNELLVFAIEYLDIVETVYLASSRSIKHDGQKGCHSLARMMKDLEIIESVHDVTAINKN